ncbi:MAG: L7Ae/L30e/S12e/Gadd45 family ribosomal protein [Petrotogales bacterium]
MGICRRSGNVVFGKEIIKKAVNKKSNDIVLVMANDTGKSLSKYILGLSKRNNIDIVIMKNINKKQLGKSIGRSEISVVGVTDRILASKILKKTKSGGVASVQDSCL